MFTSTETSKRKKESLQPVFDRIKPDQDGRLLLLRAEENANAPDPIAQAAANIGLHQIAN